MRATTNTKKVYLAMMARLSVLLGRIHPGLGELWGLQLWIFLLVATLTSLFLVGYLVQGTRVGIQLGLAITRIKALKRAKLPVNPDHVNAVFKTEPLNHLWDEYSDTLHELTRVGNGAERFSEVRASVPAEMFFTREVLVDSRLFDEFTRHLPGVLTGLGIIGTFAGLLEGLSRFDATSSTTAVAGLKSLLTGVAHAFTASAIAIGCAMSVLFISRLALAIFYRQVESLNRAIDALYATGAGEEYLSRLVHSSEMSGAQSAELEKTLIEDLTVVLNNAMDRQIAAQLDNSRSLARNISAALDNSFAGPVNRLTEAIDMNGRGNARHAASQLESLLTRFATKIGDSLIRQRRDINAPADQMDANDNIRGFLNEFSELVADEQRQLGRTTEGAVAALEQLAVAIAEVEEAVAQLAPADGESERDLSERNHSLSTAFECFGNQATELVRKALDDSDRQVRGGVLHLIGVVQEFRSALVDRKGA